MPFFDQILTEKDAVEPVPGPTGLVSMRFGWFGRARLFWSVVAFAVLAYGQLQFWKQPSEGDRANWDYFAQVIARGGIPYRDVVNIKTPLSAYVGAAAIIIARPFGLRDIFAIRITFILLAALTVAFTFLMTLDSFESIAAALLAVAIMLSFDVFSGSNAGGIQPKTPMVLFGLMTLWAITKDHPLLAGSFGMLSALSWQPGLLFVGVAGLAFSHYLTRWQGKKVVRLLAGAVIPLTVYVAYFYLVGALSDVYIWTIKFTATVYAFRETRSVSNFFERLSEMLKGQYYRAHIYFYLATAGLCLALGREIYGGLKSGISHFVERAPRHAVIIAPLIYFAFCAVDIQGAADLIPLIPFIAVFSALVLVYVTGRECTRLASGRWEIGRVATIRLVAVALVTLWVLFLGMRDAFLYERGFPTLQDQDELVREIVSHLEPGDKIFVHGRTEILVLARLTNASRYFFLDRGKDSYLDGLEPGGFAGWFERLKSERPRIVALARLGAVDHEKDFLDWVATDYEPRLSRVFNYYVRR